MSNNSRWIWFLMGRIVVHALAGGIFCGVFGGLLIAVTGMLVGCVLELSPVSATSLFGAYIGLVLGAMAGAAVGTVAFGVVGFFSPPQLNLWPTQRILGAVLRSMFTATAGIIATFFLLAGVYSFYQDQSFQNSVSHGLTLIMYSAPLIMAWGIIPGASAGCRLEMRGERSMEVAADGMTLVEAN